MNLNKGEKMPEFITLGEVPAVLVSKNIGRMRYNKEFEVRPGGAEGTVAVGVKRLGHSSGWISQLGEDEFGHYILSLIRGEGVDVSKVHMIPDKQTGIFIRERLPHGEARHFYYRTCSAFSVMSPESLDENYIASSKILHITGITPALSNSCRKMIFSAVNIAKKHNVKVIFDLNMRLKLWSPNKARPIMEELMVSSDYILPGLEDLRLIYGENKQEKELIKYLHDLGCKIIILKVGEKGAILSLPSQDELIKGYAIENPVDLMGAGDAFAAGFISGVLKGMELKEAINLANLVASLSIQLPGNIESLPTWDEVMKIKKGEKIIKR